MKSSGQKKRRKECLRRSIHYARTRGTRQTRKNLKTWVVVQFALHAFETKRQIFQTHHQHLCTYGGQSLTFLLYFVYPIVVTVRSPLATLHSSLGWIGTKNLTAPELLSRPDAEGSVIVLTLSWWQA